MRTRLRLIFKHGEELNRRVDIERELMEIYQGKRPLPTREDCKKMALRLGTPKEHWPEYLKR